jgi:cyclic pyranopterin phosphate synthase
MSDQEIDRMREILQDGFGRRVDYLRISVTDRCNLRCFYCMPKGGVPFLPSSQILRYEEILKLADLFLELGVKKIRITGGEPLVRKNILFLLQELGKRKSLEELVLTTNGTKLHELAYGLLEAGVKRVNVSLDTLIPFTFLKITGIDLHGRVMRGISEAASLGLKIKVNVVAMRGVNDQELQDFVRYGIDKEVDICFIEIMPHAYNSGVARDLFIPRREIFKRIKAIFPLFKTGEAHRRLTADVYGVKGSEITLGFISALSHPFCERCNRVRLTPDGRLKTCLFGEKDLDLRALIQSQTEEDLIKKEICLAVRAKPAKHNLKDEWGNLAMHRVGG